MGKLFVDVSFPNCACGSKKNVVADALSRKPQVSAVSISYHNELEEMKAQYAEDEDFARIYDQIVNGQRHEHYTLKSDFLMMHGKLCITKQLRPKVLIECHASSYAGHRGIDAIVKAVDTFFYWPTLRRDVDAFVRSCLVCQKVKFDRRKAPGLLQPLPIRDKPWESIAMDFIFDLPRTPTGNDGIWTIICRFSKQAHFVPVRKKIKSEYMVKLFMHNIFKYHGMPQSIVSDRDPRMTSLFWKALVEKMGTALKFSSSFHPQTDGQSEEANSFALDLLKCYVSEHKFYTFLETTLVTLALLPHFIAFFADVEEDSGSPGKLAATFLGFVLNLAFALSVLGFLIMHASLVAGNSSTIEAYEKKVSAKWKYDLGRKRNFEQVFGARRSYWLIPSYAEEDMRRLPALHGLDFPCKPDVGGDEL
ncbi:hypothetical protein L7F22_060907 [Adiantum nelumboides]|nr:hypothetical protein [Adiantum nelumboides]